MISLPSATPETQSLIELNRAKIIGSILSKSLPDLSDSRCRFIPRNALIAAVPKQIVSAFLQSFPDLGGEQHLNSIALAESISPPPDGCHCGQARCTGGRIIFAALLAISKENLIPPLFKPSDRAICDNNLSDLSQAISDIPQILPEGFQSLTTEEFERFIHFTWQMRSPIFEGLNPERLVTTNSDTIIELNSNVPLPWILLRQVETLTEEDVTRVQKIQIHGAHHDSGIPTGDLALKTFLDRRLAEMAEKSCKKELRANYRTPQHKNILPLLAVFKHRGRFHLILPWADGGNLAEFFRRNQMPICTERGGMEASKRRSEAWVLSECFGLADGLAAIHGINPDTQHTHTSSQMHADIKPENILCFASNNAKYGPFILKLADFGEAQEVRADTRDVEAHRVAHTKTYRPPEHDTDALLTLHYDVWCLGCVYLVFLSWAIAGLGSIDEFEVDRFHECDDAEVDMAKGTVLRDTFFKKVAEPTRPRFLSSITSGHKTKMRFDPNGSKNAVRKRHIWWFEYTKNHAKSLVKDRVQSVSLIYACYTMWTLYLNRFCECMNTY